jgi:beta-1,4-N-acetylgalactosaminyltransferase 2
MIEQRQNPRSLIFSIMNDITVCIPTFERPNCLELLLKSIREYYPDIKILVADNGKERPAEEVTKKFNATYFRLDYDVGLSAARNFLVDKVSTPFLFLTDDDTIFTKNTKLEILKQEMIIYRLNILGVCCLFKGVQRSSFRGSLYMDGEILRKDHSRPVRYWGNDKPVVMWHVINNYFLARTETLKKARWDERLKMAEHVEFFWRNRNILRVGETRSASITHQPWADDLYRTVAYNRRDYYNQLSMDLMGIKGKAGRPLKVKPEKK